jgi:hypothetical protein
MRLLSRFIAAGAATFLLSIIGASPANAGTCYDIVIGGQTTTICPFQ